MPKVACLKLLHNPREILQIFMIGLKISLGLSWSNPFSMALPLFGDILLFLIIAFEKQRAIEAFEDSSCSNINHFFHWRGKKVYVFLPFIWEWSALFNCNNRQLLKRQLTAQKTRRTNTALWLRGTNPHCPKWSKESGHLGHGWKVWWLAFCSPFLKKCLQLTCCT